MSSRSAVTVPKMEACERCIDVDGDGGTPELENRRHALQRRAGGRRSIETWLVARRARARLRMNIVAENQGMATLRRRLSFGVQNLLVALFPIGRAAWRPSHHGPATPTSVVPRHGHVHSAADVAESPQDRLQSEPALCFHRLRQTNSRRAQEYAKQLMVLRSSPVSHAHAQLTVWRTLTVHGWVQKWADFLLRN